MRREIGHHLIEQPQTLTYANQGIFLSVDLHLAAGGSANLLISTDILGVTVKKSVLTQAAVASVALAGM